MLAAKLQLPEPGGVVGVPLIVQVTPDNPTTETMISEDCFVVDTVNPPYGIK